MIEVLRLGFDAMDAFRTVAHDPNWPYIVGALRLLIRTFVKSLPTNAGCNGLSSTKPFPEAMLLQARNSVDLHVRDPTFPGTRVAVNGLSTWRGACNLACGSRRRTPSVWVSRRNQRCALTARHWRRSAGQHSPVSSRIGDFRVAATKGLRSVLNES